MADSERHDQRYTVLIRFLDVLPTLVQALQVVVVSAIVGATVVLTSQTLAGKTTNATFRIVVNSELTKYTGIGGPAVLGGGYVVYRRRKKKLQTQQNPNSEALSEASDRDVVLGSEGE
jgi:LPXTG-motif cell wall-anchored protein